MGQGGVQGQSLHCPVTAHGEQKSSHRGGTTRGAGGCRTAVEAWITGDVPQGSQRCLLYCGVLGSGPHPAQVCQHQLWVRMVQGNWTARQSGARMHTSVATGGTHGSRGLLGNLGEQNCLS